MPQYGVLLLTDAMPVEELESYARRLESLGYDTLWVPEIGGREPFAASAHLLARTTRIGVGTGIANVYARDAVAAAQGRRTLGEFSGGRFTLGLGVSHPFMVERRGHEWVMPVPKMRRYLDDIAAAQVDSPEPAEPAPVIIAAHGPKLLQLASEKSDGAFMYLMPPERVREGRRILGPDKELHVVMRCCLCDDPDQARATARRDVSLYVGLPAYQRVWKSIGFADADFDDSGSDRLIDTVVAWGDEQCIRERIAAYIDAGASHVVLTPSNPEKASASVDWRCLEVLAPE